VLIVVAGLVLPMAKAEEEKQHPPDPLQRGSKSSNNPLNPPLLRGSKSSNNPLNPPLLRGTKSSNNPLSPPLLRGSFNLQEKINEARDGEVIIVPEGVYTGNITITKPITIKGENAKKCVIEFLGDVPAINIRNVKNVTIENLTVRWSQKSTDKFIENGAAVAVRDANAVLENCLLEPIDRPTKTPYGLLAQGRSDVTFARGQTKGFAYTIMFTDGANGTVSDSFLEGAGHSVVTLHANSKVAITHNILARCGYHAVRNTGGTMDMKNNLIIDNNRAGAYLGNRSAHGIIENNLFTRNNGAIWAYASSDVKIFNNLFIDSKNAAIGFRDSCKLKIDKNSFVNNPTALIRYKNKDGSNGRGATIGQNHYWKNEKDNVDLKSNDAGKILSGNPVFINPKQGNFSVRRGSTLEDKGNVIAGLTNPNIINSLWKVYTKKTDKKIKSNNNPLRPPEHTPGQRASLRGNSSRKDCFVRLVVGTEDMTFEGIKTTWEKLPALLEKIPDRKSTVFELAKADNFFDENAFVDIYGKTVRLGRKFNFKYVSNIGRKMLSSKGTVQHEGEFKLRQRIPVELIAGTAKRSKVLRTKWVEFFREKAGISAGLNIESKNGSETRWKIRASIHAGEKYQEKDIIYNTKNNKKNLVFKFDNEKWNPEKFKIIIEQVKLPAEQVSILSTFTIKSIDGVTTNIKNVLAQPKVTVLMGMKAEMVVGSENPVSGSEDEFSGLKAEFLPEIKSGAITLRGKLSVTDKTKIKTGSEISWNSKKGTETNFKIENIIPGKEYIISPVPYDKNSFLEIKLIVSGFENKFLKRIVDNIDLPFVDDPEIIGTWKSVDFVKKIEDFHPENKKWKGGELFLKEMDFYKKGGKVKLLYIEGKRDKTWTKGVVLDDRSKTASRYRIKEINGQKYLFFEWKSGDYTIRHRKPKYYVLKKYSLEKKGN